MKIVAISDTHTYEPKLPKGDLLIHAGDCSFQGNIQEISKFNTWLGKIKKNYTYGIIFIPGNHDFLFETNETLAREIMTNAIVLISQEILINGFKIYGEPRQPEFNDWAFNVPRGEKLKQYWDLIPTDTDILVTHGPPKGYLDFLIRNGSQAGCSDLLDAIDRIQPKLHIFGHIHWGYGKAIRNKTKVINASICTEDYRPINKPFIINISRKKLNEKNS